jgi:hypothetical protein
MFLGELGEEGSESVEILASPVWWNEHSGDNQLDFGILRPGSRQNLVEILAGGFRGMPRRASFPPKARIKTSIRRFRTQSRRAQSSGRGFPLRPAFTTLNFHPRRRCFSVVALDRHAPGQVHSLR